MYDGRTDYHPVTVTRCLYRLCWGADAHADQYRHIGDGFETRGDLDGASRQLGPHPGHPHKPDAIYETAGPLADPGQPIVRGRGGSKQDRFDASTSRRIQPRTSLLQRKVGQDAARHPRNDQRFGKPFQTHAKGDVVVGHHSQRYAHIGIPKGVENAHRRSTTSQSHIIGGLDRRTIHYRIRERHPDFDHVGTSGGHRPCRVQPVVAKAAGDVHDEAFSATITSSTQCRFDRTGHP